MSEYLTRERNLTMLTDYYEYSMINGYFHAGIQDKIAVFDVFFRRVPENGGFAIYAGLQQVIELINGLSFTEEDDEYFRKKGCFSEEFFNFLRSFKFCCEVWSIREGTPIFPNEPIITVRGPLEQVQMSETMLLVTFNFETLIATKASRLIRAAQGRTIVEFGSRRAQGYDAAMIMCAALAKAEEQGLTAGTAEYKAAVIAALNATDMECVTGHVTYDEFNNPEKTAAIINITGGDKVSLYDAQSAVAVIQDAAGGEIDTIFGIAINEQLGDAIIVTVTATGCELVNEPDEPQQVKPQPRVGNPGVRTEPQQSGRRPQVREDDEDDKEIPDFFFNR